MPEDSEHINALAQIDPSRHLAPTPKWARLCAVLIVIVSVSMIWYSIEFTLSHRPRLAQPSDQVETTSAAVPRMKQELNSAGSEANRLQTQAWDLLLKSYEGPLTTNDREEFKAGLLRTGPAAFPDILRMLQQGNQLMRNDTLEVVGQMTNSNTAGFRDRSLSADDIRQISQLMSSAPSQPSTQK